MIRLECKNCGSASKNVTDWSHGDIVCTGCGMVLEETIIMETEPEYRIFSEDSASENNAKARASKVGTSIFGCDLSSEFQPNIDEIHFHSEGMSMMTSFFDAHFSDTRDKFVENRAKEIFEHVFQRQRAEKRGDSAFHRSYNRDSRRLKFSRKKSYVVASIWIGFMDKGA